MIECHKLINHGQSSSLSSSSLSLPWTLSMPLSCYCCAFIAFLMRHGPSPMFSLFSQFANNLMSGHSRQLWFSVFNEATEKFKLMRKLSAWIWMMCARARLTHTHTQCAPNCVRISYSLFGQLFPVLVATAKLERTLVGKKRAKKKRWKNKT